MSREEQVVDALLDWHKENRHRFPWRDEKDPYKVLVAEFLLQRTPATRVAEVYPAFIAKYPTPQDLAIADIPSLTEEFRRLGLLKRMKWLVESMKIVSDQYYGKIPDSKKSLKKLPGVGEYTASAVLCFAYDVPTELVDVNVIRILSRIFNIPVKTVFEKAREIIPNKSSKSFNESLIDFSAKICKKNPKCSMCGIKSLCKYPIKGN